MTHSGHLLCAVGYSGAKVFFARSQILALLIMKLMLATVTSILIRPLLAVAEPIEQIDALLVVADDVDHDLAEDEMHLDGIGLAFRFTPAAYPETLTR